MNKQNQTLVAASLGMLLAVTPVYTLHAADAPDTGDLPAVLVGGQVNTTATVEAVDQTTRAVTLRSESGEAISFVAGDEVRNLAQVKVGDIVEVSYSVGLIMALAPSSSGIRERHETIEAGRAELGQKPAGIVRKTVEVTATVRGVDMEKRTVTLQGPLHTVTLPVAEDIDLGSIKVGDQVDAMYRETLAVSVMPAPAK
jgi:Cu/Ag efflux protein CusF